MSTDSSTSSTAPVSQPADLSPATPVDISGVDSGGDASRRAIGSQRSGSAPVVAKSQIPSKAEPAPRNKQKVVVPNVRDRFAPDMEIELALAMGGASVEEVLSQSKAAATLAPDTRMTARVLQVHRDDVFVDLGGKTQGVLSAQKFAEPPVAGAMLDVIVDQFNAEEGLYNLRLPGGAVDVGDWSEVSNGMIVEARVTGANKGGLECEVNKLRAFIPAGQVSQYRIEDLSTLIGEKFSCLVTECNPQRRNLILSRRAVIEYEKEKAQEKMWAELAEGQIREGTVRSLQDFGAFVDMGGVDGLIHISQMSWKRIRHPSELLKVGDSVKVLIRKIDHETKKIGLTLRDLTNNPWNDVTTKYPVTSNATGTVTRVMDFGAFVELEPGIEGLVHISELSHGRVFRVSDVVKVGDTVEVKVMSIDVESQRVGLSIKANQSRPEPKKKDAPVEDETPVEPYVPKHTGPLKGGIKRVGGGEQFGLKW